MPVGAHTINPRQHRLRHGLLHKHLVEVVTDYRLETGESEHATIEDLMTWSRDQVDPDRDTNPDKGPEVTGNGVADVADLRDTSKPSRRKPKGASEKPALAETR